MNRISISRFIFLAALTGSQAFAAELNPQSFTYQGRLMNAAGTAPLAEANITVKIGIYAPTATCLLYEEEHTVDTSTTSGAFSIRVGNGTRVDSTGVAFVDVFKNSGSPAGCTVAAGDRRKMRVTVTPNAGAPIVLSPDQELTSVPQALVADRLQGYQPSDFILSSGNVTGANLATLTGGGDTSLHHHDTHNDSRYVQQGGTGDQSLGTGKLAVGTGTASSQLDVVSGAAATVGFSVKGASGQSANLVEVKNSTGTNLVTVSSAGVLAGNGSGLTDLNASNISSGTLDAARLPTTAAIISGSAGANGNFVKWNGSGQLVDGGTLGTAAALNVGTAANDVVQLVAGGKLPAVDGSNLTNLPAASEADTLASVTGRGATTTTAVSLNAGATVKGTTTDSSAAALNVTDSASASKFYVRNDGNVGVGPTNPAAKLSIVKNAPNSSFGPTDGALMLQSADSGNYQSLRMFVDGTNNFSTIQSAQTAVGMNNLALNPGGGNVGVGTTNPQASLDILNSAAGVALNTSDGTVKTRIWNGSNAGFVAGQIGTATNHALAFHTNGGAAQMTLSTSGSVGIGTTQPATKLQVSGVVSSVMVSNATDATMNLDVSAGNIFNLSAFVCDGAKVITLQNAVAGGSYTLMMPASHTGACIFKGNDGTTSVKFSGGATGRTPTASYGAVFTFLFVDANNGYGSMVDNMQ